MNPSTIGRVVKYANIAIGLVLVIALAGAYWFVWRPLPQRSGEIACDVAAPVAVSFDKLGEPHIRAANLEDALFAQGYVTAQDRLWQMDALRR
jgi:penicillin amidase